MKALLPLMALLLASLASAAPATPGVRILKDVAYLPAGRAEKLDVYLPAVPAAGKGSPAVVWIHGGGWGGGTKDEARALEICSLLAEAGYVAVSIDYVLGRGAWPQNLLDCKNAVRFLRARAAEYHVDADRIAVAGGSAGGHLALMVGFTAGRADLEPTAPYPGVSSAVRAIIDMYGPTNLLTRRETSPQGEPSPMRKLMGESLARFGAKSDDDPVLHLASPVNHVTKSSPPVLVLHGKADPTVDYPQSDELVAVLRREGVPHEYLLLDGIGHTFAWKTWGKRTLPRDLTPVALGFLRKHLGE